MSEEERSPIILQGSVQFTGGASKPMNARAPVRLATPATPPEPARSTGPAPADFPAAIREESAKGLPARLAITSAAEKWPSLFREHLKEINGGGGYPKLVPDLFPAPAAAGSFEGKVAELEKQGKSKAEAVRQVAREFPELHRDYIARINR
jgi:hypothetical protein